jgi:hypothetical protein
MKTMENVKRFYTIWNDEKDAILRDLYPTTPNGDIAKVIGCSDYTVSLRAKKLGLTRAPDYNQYAFKGRYTHTGRYRNYDRRTK